MATYTTHYNLKKPDTTDLVKVSDLNENFDEIDQKIYEAGQSGGAATGMIETATETTATAAHSYVVGEHFIYNDTLYEATAAIDIGDTITPGTNCDAVTVAGELEGKKNLQSPVSDPSASGNSLTFIDSITQNAQGVVSATKKTVQTDASPTQDSTNPVQSGGVYTDLAGKLNSSLKGAVNGIAELDASGKVPSAQLPSYVDDVIEGYYYNGAFYSDSAHTTAITPESGKIYVDITDPAHSLSYRWSGSAYVNISNPIDIDDTLTQQGKAADAKAVGDGLALKAPITDVQAGTEAQKAYHLGFYFDSEGYLCQD